MKCGPAGVIYGGGWRGLQLAIYYVCVVVAPYNCVTVVFLVTHMVSGFLSYDTVQEGINKTIDHAGFSPYIEISGGPFKEHLLPKKIIPSILYLRSKILECHKIFVCVLYPSMYYNLL